MAKCTPDELFAFLETLSIASQTHTHPPVFTVDQSQALRGDLPGGHCKNLFLKDKKGVLWLVVALESRRVNLKALKKTLGSAHLSFGKPELLETRLGVEPGSVTPFALINDREAPEETQVRVAIDRGLLGFEVVNFHPLHNAATTAIQPEALLAFVRATGREPMVIELPESAA